VTGIEPFVDGGTAQNLSPGENDVIPRVGCDIGYGLAVRLPSRSLHYRIGAACAAGLRPAGPKKCFGSAATPQPERRSAVILNSSSIYRCVLVRGPKAFDNHKRRHNLTFISP
jgi:hypothetical protein